MVFTLQIPQVTSRDAYYRADPKLTWSKMIILGSNVDLRIVKNCSTPRNHSGTTGNPCIRKRQRLLRLVIWPIVASASSFIGHCPRLLRIREVNPHLPLTSHCPRSWGISMRRTNIATQTLTQHLQKDRQKGDKLGKPPRPIRRPLKILKMFPMIKIELSAEVFWSVKTTTHLFNVQKLETSAATRPTMCLHTDRKPASSRDLQVSVTSSRIAARFTDKLGS